MLTSLDLLFSLRKDLTKNNRTTKPLASTSFRFPENVFVIIRSLRTHTYLTTTIGPREIIMLENVPGELS